MSQEVYRIDRRWNLIDTRFFDVEGIIGCYLIDGGGELSLIETGPTSTADTVLRTLEAAGYDLAAVTKVIVTHIHLDHAGASGYMLERLPRAKLYVHRVGYPHMADPSRLLASAARIYGDQLERLWGKFVPVPEDRMVALDDGDQIDASGCRLKVVYTPGHAGHHVALWEESTGILVTGDAAGVRLQNIKFVKPPTPPPEINLELWLESIAKMRALRPRLLLLTHFGPTTDPDEHFDELEGRLKAWADIVLSGLRMGLSHDAIVGQVVEASEQQLRTLGYGESETRRMELAANYDMCVAGLERYWQRHHPELIREG